MGFVVFEVSTKILSQKLVSYIRYVAMSEGYNPKIKKIYQTMKNLISFAFV